MNIMAPQVIYKQPDEKLYVGMDFTNWLDSGVTISGPTFDYSDDITITSASVDGNIVKFFVADGIDGCSYKIQIKVTASNGEILQADGILKVRNN